jgi:hypothetical protein
VVQQLRQTLGGEKRPEGEIGDLVRRMVERAHRKATLSRPKESHMAGDCEHPWQQRPA